MCVCGGGGGGGGGTKVVSLGTHQMYSIALLIAILLYFLPSLLFSIYLGKPSRKGRSIWSPLLPP